MTREAWVSSVEAEPKMPPSSAQTIGASRLSYNQEHGKPLFRDWADLLLALVCLVMLFGAVRFSELDSDYETSTRITAAVRRVLGTLGLSQPGWSAKANAGANVGRIILVAENDDQQRLVAKTTLERDGYVVALADNGPQAVALFDKAAPRVALVLLDRATLRNAGESTMQLLKSIRPDVRILLSQQAGDKSAATSGPVAWIDRPFNAMSLAEAVRTALAGK